MMKKKFGFILLFNMMLVVIIIVVNAFLIKSQSFLSLYHLLLLVVGIVFSIILNGILPQEDALSLSKDDKGETLRKKLLNFIMELEKMSIDGETLQTAYINSYRLFQSIITDKNTNVIIERHFRNIVESELERSSRYNIKFGLVVLEIFELEKLKDVPLDNIIKLLSAISKKILRTVDVVGGYKKGLVFLLPQTDLKGAIRAGERILEDVKKLSVKNKHDQPVELKVCIGVAVFPANGKNYDILLKTAEKNIEQAKLLGGNHV
ncbi:MAG: diguanylate cyclase, partial [Spirochaetes bacterium]|nr:diguanylate cyclase [Spirochaetota bacterium]